MDTSIDIKKSKSSIRERILSFSKKRNQTQLSPELNKITQLYDCIKQLIEEESIFRKRLKSLLIAKVNFYYYY